MSTELIIEKIEQIVAQMGSINDALQQFIDTKKGTSMKEWDNRVFRCDTCDNLLLWEQYNDDARMCKACAEVNR